MGRPISLFRLGSLVWVLALVSLPATASDIDSFALQRDAALVISASGQVSTEKNGQDWAIGPAEHIWVTKPITTGPDGYARLQVLGGSSFEVFAHSKVRFRKNPGNPQDLLDITTGRVRLQIVFSSEQPLQTRVLTPAAIITCHAPAAFAIAVDDEDNTVRVDVQQGEIQVQHALLPRDDPVVVKGGDSIAVGADEPIVSRKLDRGSLYHYAFHVIWKTLGSAVPGHSAGKDAEPQDRPLLASVSGRLLDLLLPLQ
jgi:ferric-dicitrate binding protein FerR (iron transport regulator)